jgi:hypothetical protein
VCTPSAFISRKESRTVFDELRILSEQVLQATAAFCAIIEKLQAVKKLTTANESIKSPAFSRAEKEKRYVKTTPHSFTKSNHPYPE